MKKLLCLLLALAAVLSLTACSGGAGGSETAGLPVTDRQGNAITVPEKIERLISMAPAITEVVVDLGLADKLVAVDTYSVGIEGIPTDVVTFDMYNPDAEKLASLGAQLLLASGMSQAGTADDPFAALAGTGVCIAYIPTSDTLESVKLDVQFIADALGESQKGAKLVSDMQAEIDRLKAIGERIAEPKTVLFEQSASPAIYSFGAGVYLNECLEIVGAKNVFADQNGWLAVSDESAIAANPDVILTVSDYLDDPVAEILSREAFQNVTAVKNKAVFQIDTNISSRPNHHLADAMREIGQAIYPELYK